MVLGPFVRATLTENPDQLYPIGMPHLEHSLGAELEGLCADRVVELVVELVVVMGIIVLQFPIRHLGDSVQWQQVHEFGVVNEDAHRHLRSLQQIDQGFRQALMAVESIILPELLRLLIDGSQERAFGVSEASDHIHFPHTVCGVVHYPLDGGQKRVGVGSFLAFPHGVD